ncbi:MAG TPA: L,D-transpeptidase, partial [Solirubrobacteraceae bacterium]|nr:L,D-transpeptidase [Solirubrobacteraceae bacterium]
RGSSDGHHVDEARLARAINSALQDPAATRVLHVRVVRDRPAVTAADLPRRYPTVVTIDRGHFRLRLFKRLRYVTGYPIAVGRSGLSTPAGYYHVTERQINPPWHVPHSAWAGSLAGQTIPGGAPSNPLKARWLGLANGVGIHGTAEDWSIGSRASHGCIRMHVHDVIALYRRVPLGTTVLIR